MKYSTLLLICAVLASSMVSVGCSKSSSASATSGTVTGVATPGAVSVVTAK